MINNTNLDNLTTVDTHIISMQNKKHPRFANAPILSGLRAVAAGSRGFMRINNCITTKYIDYENEQGHI